MHPNVKIDKSNFYIGLPTADDKEKIDAHHKDGGKIIWVVTLEEAKLFSCPYGDTALLWESDMGIKEFLLGYINSHKGGEIWGATSDGISRFARLLGDIAELHSFDARSATVLSKDQQPFKNGLRNYRWVEDGVPLARLKDMAKQFKSYGLIVAAGPSLNTQWPYLKKLHPEPNSGCVIGVGRSFKMLMQHGICPEFIVEAEQFEWNAKMWYFAPQPPNHTMLCTPIQVAPDILRAWPGEKCILLDHPTGQLMGMKQNEDTIDGGNSVAHLAFNLAVRLGCNPIYFAGIDLAYPNGEKEDTHANGTFHQGWPGEVLKNEHAFQGNLPVEANDGTMVQSSQPYVNFKTFFELQVLKAKRDNPELRIYTFSKRGQKITGVEYLELETWNFSPPSSSPVALPSSAASVSSVGVPFPSNSPSDTSVTPPKP